MALFRINRFSLSCLAWIVTIAVSSSQAYSAEEITVLLKSGRSFTGYVDAKTNASELVMRFEEGWATLWRPIAWQNIVSAEYKSKSITPAALEQGYHNLSSESAVEQWLASEGPLPTKLNEPPVYTGRQAPPAEREFVKPQVQSLVIQASLGNWNRGVERDGLVVSLFPLDSAGQIIPVSGTAEITLLGLRPSSARSKYVYHRGNPFPTIGRWTRRIYHNEVTSSGVQFQLPFQAYHPEFDLELAPHGMVQVQLTIPGYGTFTETVELIRIRPFSPLRDIRQQLDGTRFFPHETLSSTQ